MYDQFQMRRGFSTFLILFFGLGPLTALMSADDDLRLPACCRRHGAHHCAMAAEMAELMALASSGKPILTAPLTCPIYPGNQAGTATPTYGLAASQGRAQGLVVERWTPVVDRTAQVLSPVRTRAGRGPPDTSLS